MSLELEDYSNMEKIDEIDIKLLKLLQDNSRLTTKELADRVNLSTTPVFERVKRLEREGYIKKYVAILDAEKLNRGFVIFSCVKLVKLNSEIALKFEETVKKIPQISECYNISGEFDYLLKIHVPDMRSYHDLILDTLGRIENLGSISSMFVMEEVKDTLLSI